jgi:hypothetical protein
MTLPDVYWWAVEEVYNEVMAPKVSWPVVYCTSDIFDTLEPFMVNVKERDPTLSRNQGEAFLKEGDIGGLHFTQCYYLCVDDGDTTMSMAGVEAPQDLVAKKLNWTIDFYSAFPDKYFRRTYK